MANRRAVILVVNDQDASRFVKTKTLRRAGFTVHEAVTGRDALAAIDALGVELVVLDINLPDISGLEVTRRIRENERPPAVQVLQISNTAITTGDRVRGLEQGADVYLTEPIAGEILVATVDALLRVRRAEAALAAVNASAPRAPRPSTPIS